MSSNFQDVNSIKTNAFTKGMVKDVSDMYLPEGIWTHAVNAVNNSHLGEVGTIGNEPSNLECGSATYTVIGIVHKTKSEWIVFSTDNTNSEIGIYNEVNCVYNMIVRDSCLGFKLTHLITGVVKLNYDCSYSVYFQDGLNPDRVLNLDNIPYKEIPGSNTSPDPNCIIPEYTDDLDCDKLRLHPIVNQPCVNISKGDGAGQLSNGSYIAVIAYSENGIKLTEYSIPSSPQSLWNHSGIGGSIEVNVENLDKNFSEYELVVISVINQQTICKKIGNYSTDQTKVTLDLIPQSLTTIDIKQIPLRNIVYEKSDKMFETNGYLIRTGVTSIPDINYQPFANLIRTKWVSVEYPVNYYFNGGNVVGYMRDEVYSFFIRWVYNTGARSASFHIPGRRSKTTDNDIVSTSDVINVTQNKTWQVYDTSTKSVLSGTAKDNGIITHSGDMGYHESTERYPNDNPEVWGELCGKPIRHHKMPSNETTHIHKDGDTISVLGVTFSNIKHPIDNNNQPITNIVGYEILRGSREGHRSIVAKGLFNNMWEYSLKGNSSKTGLYQNYPYNDLRPDKFLTTVDSTLDVGSGNRDNIEDSAAPSVYKQDIFSFHSVETTFDKPYLSDNYVKIYREESGNVLGNFEELYKHPKQKLITDVAFTAASVIGIGLGLIASMGKVTTDSTIYPLVAGSGYGGITTHRESSAATILGDIVNNITTSAASGLGGGNALATIAGFAQIALNAAIYIGRGFDEALDIIYKIIPYRNYILQYNSHGFYKNSSSVNNTQVPLGINHSFTRKVVNNGAKYIGNSLQDLDNTYRINNLNRNRYVAVKLSSTIPDPQSIVDNTRQRIRDGISATYDKPNIEFLTNTVSYYGAIKVDYQNQYGQISSIVQIPTDSCVIPVKYVQNSLYSTGVIFGGDIYINRFTEKNPYYFFNSWLINNPDGTPIDYRNYVNGPVPRYWVDFNKYDASDLSVSVDWTPPPGHDVVEIITPSDFHRLDRPVFAGSFSIRNSYIYMSCNGVRDFFTESEYNMAYRDYGETDEQKFHDPYGSSFNNLTEMFRSDKIKSDIYNKYDLSLSASKLFNNFASWGKVLSKDFNPKIAESCFSYQPKRAVYSLQHQEGLKRDNWKNYLPLNYRDFNGKINNIKSLNGTGAIILFENNEPSQFVGQDSLRTDGGVKVTVGDGGLFQQNLQSIVNADDSLEYGSSISSRGVVNTPHGLFWINQKSGKIMNYSGGIDEISKYGMKHWFIENLPSKMLSVYPNYPYYDNPVLGIGCQTIYDSQYEMLYFTKKDYIPQRTDLLFDDPNGVPYYICGEGPGLPSDPNYPFLQIPQIFSNNDTPISCTQPIDLAVVLDITGSMLPSINSIKGNLSSIVSELATRTGNNYRLALVTVDETAGTGAKPYPYGLEIINIACTFSLNNGVAFSAAVNAIVDPNPSAGGDLPEPTDIGINEVLTGACGTFRPTATKMIVLITDALPSGGDDTYDITDTNQVTALSNTALANGVKIITINLAYGINDPDVVNIMNVYSGITNGIYYEDESDGDYVGNRIIESIQTINCEPSCEINVSSNYVEYGDSVLVSWTTTNVSSVTIEHIGVVGTSGTALIYPSRSLSIVLTGLNPSGIETTCSIAIYVNAGTFLKCPCNYNDPNCFKQNDWTISYDPKNKSWISFHNWIPSLMIPSFKHFLTIKDRGFWRHNSRWDNYCNFYDTDYPWEVEYNIATPNNTTVLRSIEYELECFKYSNDGKDFKHILDENFDRAVVYNSEQISGLLKLKTQSKNDPLESLSYPLVTNSGIEILVSKEENKYRFNQFWDITKNRGEFTLSTIPMWTTSSSGVSKLITSGYIDYNKNSLERKYFRHYGNRIILRRNQSSYLKMILKLTNSKHTNSSR